LVRLLLADDDARLRSLLVSRIRDADATLAILEAEDGAQAVQLGLQRRPQIALLDVNMPRLGGIETAITLQELRPEMRIALQTGDPVSHRDRARDLRLPLFDKLDFDAVLMWLQLRTLQKRRLRCSACGYGIVRATPPERCPMCQGEQTWVHAPWRPFSRTVGVT